jgi:hypothetical protein
MEAEATPRIRPGDTVRKFAAGIRERFGHSARWGWGKLKSSPGLTSTWRAVLARRSPHEPRK